MSLQAAQDNAKDPALTLGEAAAEGASVESPRLGVCFAEKVPCPNSAELMGDAASARGLHISSVGGDPTCEMHPCTLNIGILCSVELAYKQSFSLDVYAHLALEC